jgi:hypothetical protein
MVDLIQRHGGGSEQSGCRYLAGYYERLAQKRRVVAKVQVSTLGGRKLAQPGEALQRQQLGLDISLRLEIGDWRLGD